MSNISAETENFGEKKDVTIGIQRNLCECCGLIEECTPDYTQQVKDSHSGKWVCGLCSEAVKESMKQVPVTAIEDALRSHTDFCQKFNSNRLNPELSLAKTMSDLAKRKSQNRTNNFPISKMARTNSCDPRISSK